MLDYIDAPNRRMCSLFLNRMDWGGLEIDRFGDSTYGLTGILLAIQCQAHRF